MYVYVWLGIYIAPFLSSLIIIIIININCVGNPYRDLENLLNSVLKF